MRNPKFTIEYVTEEPKGLKLHFKSEGGNKKHTLSFGIDDTKRVSLQRFLFRIGISEKIIKRLDNLKLKTILIDALNYLGLLNIYEDGIFNDDGNVEVDIEKFKGKKVFVLGKLDGNKFRFECIKYDLINKTHTKDEVDKYRKCKIIVNPYLHNRNNIVTSLVKILKKCCNEEFDKELNLVHKEEPKLQIYESDNDYCEGNAFTEKKKCSYLDWDRSYSKNVIRSYEEYINTQGMKDLLSDIKKKKVIRRYERECGIKLAFEEIKTIKSDNAKLTNQVDELTPKVDELISRVDKLEPKVDELISRVDKLEKKQKKQELMFKGGQFDLVKSQYDKINEQENLIKKLKAQLNQN